MVSSGELRPFARIGWPGVGKGRQVAAINYERVRGVLVQQALI